MTKEQMAAYDAQQRANADLSASDRAAASRAQGFVGRGGLKDPVGSIGTTSTQVETTTPSVPRNLDAEAATVKQLGVAPKTEAEQAEMILATYGDKIPSEFQGLMDRYNALQGTGDQAALGQFGQDLTAAGQNAAAFQGAVEAQAGQIPGELGILQNALKMKSGVGSQPLGESDIFKQAGVGGYGALSSSLAAHGQEMDFKYTSFANMVNQAAKFQYGENSKYAAQAKAALDQFAILQDSYRYEQSRLDDIAARTEAVQNELYTYGEKLKMDLAYEEAKNATTKLGVGGQITSSQAQNVFNIIPTGKYANGSQYHKGEAGWELGTNTWECGEGYNQITDGPKAGSTLQEKLAMRDLSITSPSVGNGLILPLGEDTGHIETVISNNNGLIQTVSWNRNLDGQQTIQSYTVDELNEKYGKNWGFTNSTLKPEYQQALAEASGPTTDPYSYGYYYGQAVDQGMDSEQAAKYASAQFTAVNTPMTEAQMKVFDAYASGQLEEQTYQDILSGVTAEELSDGINAISKEIKNDETVTADIINSLGVSEDVQRAMNSELAWIESVLRKKSGAAISASEYATYGRMYFPRVGDTSKTLEDKRRRRESQIDALYSQMGENGKKAYETLIKNQSIPEVEQEDPLVVEYKESEKANDPNYQEALDYYNRDQPSNPFNPFAGSSIKHSKSK